MVHTRLINGRLNSEEDIAVFSPGKTSGLRTCMSKYSASLLGASTGVVRISRAVSSLGSGRLDLRPEKSLSDAALASTRKVSQLFLVVVLGLGADGCQTVTEVGGVSTGARGRRLGEEVPLQDRGHMRSRCWSFNCSPLRTV